MEAKHLTKTEIDLFIEAYNKGAYHILDQEIQDHIAKCDECSNEINKISAILEEEKALAAKLEHTEQKTQNHSFSFEKTLPFIVLAIIIIGVIIKTNFNKPEPTTPILTDTIFIQDSITETDTVIAVEIEPKKRYVSKKKANPADEVEAKRLLAYKTHKNLESLAGMFSNYTLHSHEIEIKSPPTVKGKAEHIFLEWKNNDSQLLIIELFDNKGNKIYETETFHDPWQPKQITKEGLYYWKIHTENNHLLFCGKIVVI